MRGARDGGCTTQPGHPLQNDDTPAADRAAGLGRHLNDGDVLYIPRGWWHEAFPLGEPSLHLTVSLTPPTAMDYLGWVMARLRNHAELRASLPPAGDGSWRADRTAKISALVADALRAAPLEEFQRQWEANMRPNPYIHLPDAPYEQLAALSETSLVRLASLHRLSFARVGENFEFAAAGRLWTVPKTLQPALAQLQNNREYAVARACRRARRCGGQGRPAEKPERSGPCRRGAGAKRLKAAP